MKNRNLKFYFLLIFAFFNTTVNYSQYASITISNLSDNRMQISFNEPNWSYHTRGNITLNGSEKWSYACKAQGSSYIIDNWPEGNYRAEIWEYTTCSANPLYHTYLDFNYCKPKPSTPNLTQPVDNAKNTNISLSLTWTECTDAEIGELQVSTVNTFATTIFSGIIENSLTKTISGLNYGTKYYWRVRALRNSSPCSDRRTGDWSTVSNFTTSKLLYLESPDNSVMLNTFIEFKWTPVDNTELQISRSSDFAEIEQSKIVNSNSTKLGGLLFNTKYYWRVRPYPDGILSETREFTTINPETKWYWRNPLPQGNHLRITRMFENGSILVLGDLSTVLKTTNSGQSWIKKKQQYANNINSIYFPPYETQGMAPGDNGIIYKTTDDGDTWSTLNSGVTKNLNSVFMADINAGWCVGDGGTVIKTTNGGSTWGAQTSGTTNTLRGVSYANLNTGWIVGDNGTVRKTSDGGVNWSAQSTGNTNHYYGVYFFSTSTGMVFGNAGKIYRTTDGGSNWSLISSGTTANLNAASFVDNNNGWLVGDSCKILKTTNGGTSWSAQSADNTDNLLSVHFYDTENGVAVGAYGIILKTTNGGTNWSVLKDDVIGNVALNHINFVDSLNGLIIDFPADKYLKTTNGGSNWFTQNISYKVNKLTFVNSSTGWAVCDTGKIYKTTNSGVSWSSQNSNTTMNLKDVSMISTSVGWTAGDNGYLLKTTNGGNSWFSQNVGTSNYYTFVKFFDQNTGWILTSAGKILKSTDGGSTWSEKSNPANEFIKILRFSSTNLGWGVSSSGKLIKTLDGNNWSLVDIIFPNNNDVFFADSLNGWVAGDYIIKTTDGGVTWWEDGRATTENIKGLYFFDINNAWAVGARGTILKYIDTKLFSPLLASPTNNSTNNSLLPNFTWLNDTLATSYQIQVAKDIAFTNVVYSSTVATNSKQIELANKFDINTNYYWRIKSQNSTDTSSWSLIWKLTTQPQLTAPALTTPAANATGVSVNPNFTWGTSTNATKYILQVSTSVTFSNLVVNDTVTTTSRTPAATLNSTTNYYWRVRAFNEGQASDWAAYRMFTTEYIGLPVPSLSSPSDNATLVNINANLNWSSVNGATQYRVQVSLNDQFSSFVVNTVSNTNSYTLPNVAYFTTHYWRIRALNSTDSSNLSTVWSFKTKDVALSQPTLSSPTNNAVAISVSPTLNWNSLSGATKYELQVSTAANFSATVVNQTNLTGTSYGVSGLSNFIVYYWRIRGINNTDTSAYSDIWNFRTISSPLSSPHMITPTAGAGNVSLSPLFKWSSVSGATSYELQVATNTDFSTLKINQSDISDTSFAGSGLSYQTPYYWKVRAKNAEQTGDWCTYLTFTTSVESPVAPTLSSPANNAIDQATNVTVSWTAVNNATSYNLQIATDVNFTTIVVNQTGLTETSFVNSGLSKSTKYYWKVKAVNSGGESSWTTAWNFTTIGAEAVPSTWAFKDFTGNSANVLVPANIYPKIGERNFMKGDAVGFFYNRSGSMICAGYKVWNNANLSVTIWGDDSETQIKDGFNVNENYTVRIWDGQIGKEYEADVTYASGQSKYTINGFSVMGSLKAVLTSTQNINLSYGWNLISAYITPTIPIMDSVWSNIVNYLVIAKNNAGNAYIPAWEVNDIGDWVTKEGYQVYMSSAKTLSVTGVQAKPESTPISLSSGWNLVSYLRNSGMDAVAALETIVSDEALVIAKNNAGNAYIPMWEVNDIGDMMPGEGYQMYLSKNTTLTYPTNSLGKSSSNTRRPSPKYLLPQTTKTGNNAVLALKVENTENGNEIGVYTNTNLLVGSGVVFNGLAVITIWGDNDRTDVVDGAVSNAELRIMNYDVKTGKISEVSLSGLTDVITNEKVSALKYSKDKVYFANVAFKNNSAISLNIKPNPANDVIEIEFTSPDCSNTEISIYSSNGKLVDKITDKLQTLSGNTISYNVSKLSSGEYTFTMTCGNEKAMRKVVVVK